MEEEIWPRTSFWVFGGLEASLPVEHPRKPCRSLQARAGNDQLKRLTRATSYIYSNTLFHIFISIFFISYNCVTNYLF